MQKFLIVTGLLILIIGLAWPWLASLPLGRLPGDIVIERENFRFYFPLTTMVLISVGLSLLIWLVLVQKQAGCLFLDPQPEKCDFRIAHIFNGLRHRK